MEFVAARFQRGVYHRSVSPAQLRRVGVRLHLELFESVHRRHHHVVGLVQQIRQIGIIVDAVEQEVVLERSGAVCRETVALLVARTRLAENHARRELRKLHRIAAIQRKLLHVTAVNYLAALGVVRFEHRRHAGDFDSLLQFPWLQREIHTRALLDLQGDGFDLGLEAFGAHRDPISAHAHRAHCVLSGSIRGGVVDEVGGRV